MSDTVFILINPQMGENIGAAARAMANFGARHLRLVNPRDGWPNERALAMSSGGFDHLDTVEVFSNTQEALQDILTIYATTARPRDMVKPVVTPRQAAQDTQARPQGHKTAFLFGAERTGLENDDVARAHAIITCPTNPDFSSLNLGQGVLMIAYELFIAAAGAKAELSSIAPIEDSAAPAAEFDNFFARLQTGLEEGAFFRDAGLKPRMLRNLRTTLLRAQMTSQELNTFHGVIRALMREKNK